MAPEPGALFARGTFARLFQYFFTGAHLKRRALLESTWQVDLCARLTKPRHTSAPNSRRYHGQRYHRVSRWCTAGSAEASARSCWCLRRQSSMCPSADLLFVNDASLKFLTNWCRQYLYPRHLHCSGLHLWCDCWSVAVQCSIGATRKRAYCC